MPSPSWSTLLDFLDQPTVAIRIFERSEAVVIGPLGMKPGSLSFRAKVERLTYINSTFQKFVPRQFQVSRD